MVCDMVYYPMVYGLWGEMMNSDDLGKLKIYGGSRAPFRSLKRYVLHQEYLFQQNAGKTLCCGLCGKGLVITHDVESSRCCVAVHRDKHQEMYSEQL